MSSLDGETERSAAIRANRENWAVARVDPERSVGPNGSHPGENPPIPADRDR